MKFKLRLNRDPEPTPPVGGTPPEPKVWSSENIPKTKEEWTDLRGKDPVLFADLTQQNVDRMFRENKELKEANTGLQNQTNNLSVELDKYRTGQELPPEPITSPIETPPATPPVSKQPYSVHNLPKTQQEWEDLMIDNPVLGTDLRTYHTNQTMQSETKFEEAQATSRKFVQAEHPDMYLAELDEAGKPRTDEKGKVILKINQATGEPFFNPNSEKGKLWLEIANENPNIGFNPQAPELVMSSMERRLRQKGVTVVDEAAANREQQIQDGQVVQEGVQPPVQIKAEFHTEEERVNAEKAIQRGVYKDLNDYFTHRDNPEPGIYEENSMPTFGKK